MSEPLLVLDNVAKNYGAIQALRGVSFSIARGEVVALLGDNGGCRPHPVRGERACLRLAA